MCTRPCFATAAVLLLLSGAVAAPAYAKTDKTEACTVIATVPVTIMASGVYCLKSNIVTTMTTGAAITINAGNVVLDFNGFYLSNTPAGIATAAHGIFFQNRENVTIRNGSVIGFFQGIFANQALWGILIEEMRLTENRFAGIGASFADNGGGVIRNCQIDKSGGTTSFSSPARGAGIEVTAGSVEIVNNHITQTTKTADVAYGIYSSNSMNHTIVNNRVSVADIGIRMDVGAGKYRDNVTTSVTTPYFGGMNIGNNN